MLFWLALVGFLAYTIVIAITAYVVGYYTCMQDTKEEAEWQKIMEDS